MATAQDGNVPDSVLASVITQVSQNQAPQPRRAPPPRKKPVNKTNKPKKIETSKTALPAPIPLPSTSHTTPESSLDEHKVIPATDEKNATPVSSTLKGSSTHLPASSAKPSPVKKSQKKPLSPWQAFLAALGCSSKSAQASAYDDELPEMSEKPRGEKLKRKLSKKRDPALNASSTASHDTSSKTPLILSPHDDVARETEAGPSTPRSTREDLASLEMTANSSRSGVLLPREETEDVLSGAVVPPGADGHTPTGTPRKKRSKSSTRLAADAAGETESVSGASEDQEGSSQDQEGSEEEEEDFLDDQDEEDRIIAQGGIGIPIGEDGLPHPLLEEIAQADLGRKCLVLDLDETLVHSSFKMMHPVDYIVPVEIENQAHNVYVIKRPGVDEFLKRMGEIYEVVVFTASLSKYADPVLDQLDVHKVVKHRLFRESCYNFKGNYVKDLSQLGRPIGETIIIDNSPASYIFHPKNAVPCSSWFNDPHDTELTDMIGVLADLATVEDVRCVLASFIEA